MSVIVRINNLIDAHEDYSKCKGCKLCKEIERLRRSIDKDPARKYAGILSKEQNMTLSEIKLLVEKGVQKRDINKALKMDNNAFTRILEVLGLKGCWEKEEPEEMKEMALTKEKLENHLAANRSVKEIAEMEGVTPAAVYSMKNYYGIGKAKPGPKKKAVEKLEAVKQEVKQAVVENPAVEQELRELIARLEDEVGEHKINEVFLNNSIKQLKEENEEYKQQIAKLRKETEQLKASAEDTEQEAHEATWKIKRLESDIAGLASQLELEKEKNSYFKKEIEKANILRKALKAVL